MSQSPNLEHPSGSILDKIIASKEDQEKQAFDPADVITQLLSGLNEKEADVLQRRYGLNNCPQETLEAIGNAYHVTRERIRQIENLSIKKIKAHPQFAQLIKPIEHVILTVLEEHGNVMSAEHLLGELFPVEYSSNDREAVGFILSELTDYRFVLLGSNKTFTTGWQIKNTPLEFVEQAIAMLVEIIGNIGQPMSATALYDRVKQHSFYKQHASRLNQNVIFSYLNVSKKIAMNPFEEYGLSKWGSVMPKRMNDKIYLILKKMGQPMHFVDISKKITEIFKKDAYPPTVHNELILNEHYVLVGRGIYALREWGYQRGVVSDVIAAILKDRGTPLRRREIVDAVLQQRIVKKNTIHLALTNKQRFTKLADGRYVLAESTNE